MSQTDIEDDAYLGRVPQPRDVERPTVKSAAITVSNKIFAAALSRALTITGRGRTIPILECVMLHAADGIMTIEANNMEQALRQSVAVGGLVHGAGCVKAAQLCSLMQKLPPEEISSLEFTGGALSIRCGRSRFALETFPPEDYPSFVGGHSPHQFTMRCADLALIVGRVRPFVSNEETRYYLCGINLAPHPVEGVTVLRAAATNGNWLAAAWTKLPDGAAGMPNIIIPTAAVPALAALIESPGDVEVSVSDVRVIFIVDNVRFATKLISATYPEIDRVMPRGNPNILEVDRREFLRGLALTGVDIGDKSMVTRLSLAADAVSISTATGASGITHEMPDGSFHYEGVAMEIGFVNRLLTEPTKLIGDRVQFRFGDPTSFATAHDPADDTAIYVIGSYRI